MSFAWCWKWVGVAALGGLLTTNEAVAQHPTIPAAGLTKSIQAGSEINAAAPSKPTEGSLLLNAKQLRQLDEAYLDAFSILKEVNGCSAFYGGPGAILVLNRLTQQLKPYLHRKQNVAVTMSGERVKITNFPDHLSYRLFAKAELNLAGPFYRSRDLSSTQSIGGYLPNTREARVIILLHEMGHLIQKRENEWLLSDDGGNESLSQENSRRVVAACGKQINDLRRASFEEELRAESASGAYVRRP